MQCPACQTAEMVHRLDFPFRDFDGSIFNFTGKVMECGRCGQVRIAGGLNDQMVCRHYAQDCLYSLMTGVGVGGDSPEDLVRYDYYLRLLHEYGLAQSSLADIGCSRGGFLKRVQASVTPPGKLLGVDLDEVSLQALAGSGIESRVGDAFSLPFPPDSQECLCYFHVLEHIYDINAVIKESSRVLSPAGAAIFEVPDAVAYQDARVGTLFWAAMKEHVNHFTASALEAAFARHGLLIMGVHRAFMPMKGGHSYPSLIVVVRKAEKYSPVRLPGPDSGKIMAYIDQEQRRFSSMADNLKQFLSKYQSVTFWGISLEFFNLNAHGFLIGNQAVNLVDANPGKQGKAINGYTVTSPASIKPGGGLVCCSYMSKDSILAGAQKLGWAGKDIFILT